MDTSNQQMVGRRVGEVLILRPKFSMSPDEALNLAAWLVVLAEHDASTPFDQVLAAVKAT